ncbi:uncharacterized protein CTRU02_208000 [Colletotrichum truncatum]|uniref:Uncharacterized protein n=1 Tax=Colletotrichum truncatum TaxID=5467 RepID=A0ACC3YV70_COLTU
MASQNHHIPYSIVHVFNTTASKGNSLVVVDARGLDLTMAQMQLLKRQLNLSETTYVLEAKAEGATYRLRSFLRYHKKLSRTLGGAPKQLPSLDIHPQVICSEPQVTNSNEPYSDVIRSIS